MTHLVHSPAQRRAPGPVVAAAALMCCAGLVAVVRFGEDWDGWWFAAGALVAFSLYGVIAYGLWRGWRAAQILTVAGGALTVLGGLNGSGSLLSIATGAALVALVLVPASAREWFARS